MNAPRILIAGLRGGSGKTLVSLGLLAAWRAQGFRPAPFKKGPDYIDAAWLGLAAGRPCRNLDLFLMSRETVLRSFVRSARTGDVALIEGNRGLFDGADWQGNYSTAELAKLLGAPVVLVLDCTKATRTLAAMVFGCQQLDPQVSIRGVILNQTAGARHEGVVRDAVERVCGIPVVGCLPRIAGELFPERHLGLVPPQEHDRKAEAIEHAAAVVTRCLDLTRIWGIARAASTLAAPEAADGGEEASGTPSVRVGVFRDEAFQFYYPENLEQLTRQGADLVGISPIRDSRLPGLDALYIGGGFPETLASALADNRSFMESLRQRVAQGLPVYAECGGTVYLGEKLWTDSKEFLLAGVLPVNFAFGKKPKGHGYVVLQTVHENPFFPVGEEVRGHEFHYTYMQSAGVEPLNFAFRVRRGYGFDGQQDGLCWRNVLACYTHVHALATVGWAPALIRAAHRFRGCRERYGSDPNGRKPQRSDAG